MSAIQVCLDLDGLHGSRDGQNRRGWRSFDLTGHGQLPEDVFVPGQSRFQFAVEQSAGSRYQIVSLTLHRRLRKELSYLLVYPGGNARDDASDYDEQPLNPAHTFSTCAASPR